MVVNRYLNEYLFTGKASPPTDMRRGTQQPRCGDLCVPRLQYFASAPFPALVAAFMGVINPFIIKHLQPLRIIVRAVSAKLCMWVSWDMNCSLLLRLISKTAAKVRPFSLTTLSFSDNNATNIRLSAIDKYEEARSPLK